MGIEAVHRRITARPELAARLDPALPFCRAEVVHAVEQEMACTLHDVLRRRIPLLLLASPSADVSMTRRRLREMSWGGSQSAVSKRPPSYCKRLRPPWPRR